MTHDNNPPPEFSLPRFEKKVELEEATSFCRHAIQITSSCNLPEHVHTHKITCIHPRWARPFLSKWHKDTMTLKTSTTTTAVDYVHLPFDARALLLSNTLLSNEHCTLHTGEGGGHSQRSKIYYRVVACSPSHELRACYA